MSVTFSSLLGQDAVDDASLNCGGCPFELAHGVSFQQDSPAQEVWVSSEIATSIASERRRQGTERRPWRALAVQLLGPITIVGGLAWAVAQPYRIVIPDRDTRNVYDYVFQAPLLVVLVGLVFTFLVAPGLVRDLEEVARRDSEG
jgi:hypothetical protein